MHNLHHALSAESPVMLPLRCLLSVCVGNPTVTHPGHFACGTVTVGGMCSGSCIPMGPPPTAQCTPTGWQTQTGRLSNGCNA